MTNEQNGNGSRKFLSGIAGTIVAALVMQTGGLIWWAGGINARVDRVERDVQKFETSVHDLQRTVLLQPKPRNPQP